MDIIFGSSGVAQADQERMAAINAEIGLDRLIAGSSHGNGNGSGSGNLSGSDKGVGDEKVTRVEGGGGVAKA